MNSCTKPENERKNIHNEWIKELKKKQSRSNENTNATRTRNKTNKHQRTEYDNNETQEKEVQGLIAYLTKHS